MKAKILIADDEPNILVTLEYLMRREGHEVVLARDGEQALELLRSERPQLVLLDVMMPRRSGFRGLPGTARRRGAQGHAGADADRQGPRYRHAPRAAVSAPTTT